jgi:hypothetical protein
MKNQFDELAKSMAQPVGRRAALKTFGIGLAGLALAAFGLRSAQAAPSARYTCCMYTSRIGPGGEAVCVPYGSPCPAPAPYQLLMRYEVPSCGQCHASKPPKKGIGT